MILILVISCVDFTSSESGSGWGGTPVEGGERAICDSCYNGDCVHTTSPEGETYKCQCWEGWRGDKCELCGGKVKLRENGTQSWLAEAVGNYTTNMKCTWVVEAARPDSRIRLHIKDFETECGWDHLYIWDGDNIFTGLQVGNQKDFVLVIYWLSSRLAGCVLGPGEDQGRGLPDLLRAGDCWGQWQHAPPLLLRRCLQHDRLQHLVLSEQLPQ